MRLPRQTVLIGALTASPLALYGFFYLVAVQPLNNALIEAVKRNDSPQVISLLARGANVNARDRTRFRSCRDSNPPRTQRTPLMLSMFLKPDRARTQQNISMRDLLLKHGADPNIGDAEGNTPLKFAASRGVLADVKIFLDHGANVNVQNEHGDTPLIEASMRNNFEVAKLLIAHGAKVDTRGFLNISALGRAENPRMRQLLTDATTK